MLILKDPDGKPQVFRVFGVCGDAKGGNFLALSSYSNTDEQVDLYIGRRMFSGTWYKRKD